jgi:broad specificity polyphosphatase/5'/3'-nucleotidase SurE
VLPAVLVACVSVGAVAVAARRLRAVTALLPSDPESLRSAVRSGRGDAIASAVQRLFSDEDARAILSQALVDGSPPDAAIAALNEHLGDVARALSLGRTIPRSCGRVALASGTLAAVLEVTASVSARIATAWAPALWEFAVGAAGAVAAFEIDRRSAAGADRVRAAWDQVATVFVNRLGPASASTGKRSASRGPDPS